MVQLEFCQNNQISFDGVTSPVDQGKEARDDLYLDFSKAFDSVPHDIIINKLRKQDPGCIAMKGRKVMPGEELSMEKCQPQREHNKWGLAVVNSRQCAGGHFSLITWVWNNQHHH